MLSIELRFLTGRYHSTGWGHHANEGHVEWPPSPWRILRALVATWHLKCRSEIPETVLDSLLSALAERPPEYWLPPATSAHTRHYMPVDTTPSKIFDAFYQVPSEQALCVIWQELELPSEERSALAMLVARIGYLGRAESWVDGALKGEARPPNCVLAVDGESEHGREAETVLAPMDARDFAAWRARALEMAFDSRLEAKRRKQIAKGKDSAISLSKAEKAKAAAQIPETLRGALEIDTEDVRKQGWNWPPGSRSLAYFRDGSVGPVGAAAATRPAEAILPTVARFAVASQAPPRLTEAVSVADRMRSALLSHSDGAVVFAGKQPHGSPLQGHRHAFVLPESHDRFGRITHVTLFARMGFDRTARAAIESVASLWGKRGHRLQLVLLGIGQPEDFAGLDEQTGQCTIFAASKHWVSRTPFVSTRHPRMTRSGRPRVDARELQVGSPEHDLRRLLQAPHFREPLPEPTRVESVPTTDLGTPTRWLAFQTRRRSGGGTRAPVGATGFRITFPTEVRGPIVIGYGAHLGLGIFVPEVESAR
ncbi:MAG: type I-U CRISPR-associated protein Csb2 [Myxococcales bacterium]|nr:type I-U CRISPR-associated protein Csb2 [Myxococcales bacterium]